MTVAACLAALRDRSDVLARQIAALTPDEWDAETNCTPWRVHDLAAHLVSSGNGFVANIRRGLAGSTDPPQRTAADFNQADPATVATALAEVTDAFEALYDGLSEAELDTICWHRRGNRSVRWYAAHRLAEVAFHGWDLETSLGHSPRFDDEVAKLLLPTLLESNIPRTYAAGLSAERGNGERYLFQVVDEPSAAWLVTIYADVLKVSRGGGLADARVTARAADLALLVYGRTSIDTIDGVAGDRSVVERFARIFPRP